jgi:SagB-type dehydrogenase family enzyme
MGIGREFQEGTKYVRGKIPAGYYTAKEAPAPSRAYSGAGDIPLLPPPNEGGMPLWEALSRRRSMRSYGGAPLTRQQLSALLWASAGASHGLGGHLLRTAPSAGALYPIETYVAVRRVADVPSGIYRYVTKDHALSLLREGDFSGELAGAALDQTMVSDAGAVFLWTAVFGRSAVKYLERAYRYVYLDAGHIAQNLLLAATALGAAACPIAALYDDEVNAVLGVDGLEESILYMASVGTATDDPGR